MTESGDSSDSDRAEPLSACTRPLNEVYDVGLLDLDGVVWRLTEAIPGAATAIGEARQAGMRVEFVTNNASRRVEEVVDLLGRMGIPAEPQQVVTSAQAAAALLAERLPSKASVLVVGAPSLEHEIVEVGLTPVRSADERPAAVVQGYGTEVGWRDLAEVTVAVGGGAWWVATNADLTLPSARGLLPGNGALIAAVRSAVGRGPDEIVGKPHPGLHQESVRRSNARHPLVVGDRLDTDIAGANRAGVHSLLVMTGVTTADTLLRAAKEERPTYLAADLHGLSRPHPTVHCVPSMQEDVGGAAHCGAWSVHVRVAANGLPQLVVGRGVDNVAAEAALNPERSAEAGWTDALRAMCQAAWQLADGKHATKPSLVAADEPAAGLFRHWGLSTASAG